MSSPRDLLKTPQLFGKREVLEWRSGIARSVLAAADVQNRCACSMRKCIKAQYGSVKKYCADTHQNYQRVGQVLRGTASINISDIGNAINYLGISVVFLDQFSASTGISDKVAGGTFMRDAVGAFYTPFDISVFMVRKCGIGNEDSVLEPSFGDGSFLKAIAACDVKPAKIVGCEIDSAACKLALSNKYLPSESDLFHGSFFSLPSTQRFTRAIGNPPYVRLRSLDSKESQLIIDSNSKIQGARIGEESSEWLPFLLKACDHLVPGGNLAFVLPYDFTYVKYARDAWRYLGSHFSTIEVLRSKERIFENILQDVVLLFAKGKGGSTATVRYKCFEARGDLLNDRACIDADVLIDHVSNGNRAFQTAMIDSDLVELISESSAAVRTGLEAELHIGYVCGNKDYFHPSKATIERFSLPAESLKSTVVSSRQLGNTGFRTKQAINESVLWLPGDELTTGEQDYIKYGSKQGVQNGYKCRVRNPWWRVPGITTPDAIMSVFGEAPRVLVNDGKWLVSNSLLGCYLHEGISPVDFCATWYSALTLLSVELEIHSLGGGVLIAVPREASKVIKLCSNYADEIDIKKINLSLQQGKVDQAYQVGDHILEELFGLEVLDQIKQSTELLRSWRKN